MYNWVVRRITERTQGPQQVFTTIVDQTVRTWIPATVLLASCFVTPAQKKLDVRTYDWAPQPAWMFTSLTPPASTAQQWPAILENLGTNYRTAARPALDARSYDWAPQFVAPIRQVDALVATWTGIFSTQKASERTRATIPLDLRTYDWSPQAAWILSGIAPPPTTAQTWPAVLSGLPLSYRTGERARLDVRGYEWSPQTGWIQRAAEAVIATWSPVFTTEAAQVRTGDRPTLDVRGQAWAPDASPWIIGAVSPTVTTAQIGPALQQALASFRTMDAPRLDVRRHDWLNAGWTNAVVDATVAKWAPIWAAEIGYRTPDKAVLDVRSITRDPQIGWWAGVLVIVPPPKVIQFVGERISTPTVSGGTFSYPHATNEQVID